MLAIQEWEAPRKPALLPVIEMSSAGALIDNSYIERCKAMLKKYPEVIGAVCQQSALDAPLLKCTPGVNLVTCGDGNRQQYNTPTYVLQQLRSDFIIVGKDCIKTLIRHRKPCDIWKQYTKKMFFPKKGFGGIGGLYIKPTALANVRKFFELLPGVDIVGCGGVQNGADVFEHILCGASVVQIGTTLWEEGLDCFNRIENELKEIMIYKGYCSIEEFKGNLKVMR